MPRNKKLKNLSLICAMAAMAAFAGPAHAVFKCTTAKGVVYQDRPCREGTETDVRITVPTGEVMPNSSATTGDAAQANAARGENRSGASKPGRTNADDPVSVAKPGDRTDGARKKDARTSAENASAPMSADQARKTDPTAKYFATEAFGPGNETPTQMNCESPTGEKRVFYLSNGKLTSI